MVCRDRAKELIFSLRRIQEWRLLSLLGTGGMSNVYLAQHTSRPDFFCALKLSKDYVTEVNDVKEDSCYQSLVSEWQCFQAIKQSGDKCKAAYSGIPPHWGTDTAQPQRQRKESAGSLQARKVGTGKGALPTAYGFGFVKVGKEKHNHGWIAMQLLGWNLHAVAFDKSKVMTWTLFFRVGFF